MRMLDRLVGLNNQFSLRQKCDEIHRMGATDARMRDLSCEVLSIRGAYTHSRQHL